MGALDGVLPRISSGQVAGLPRELLEGVAQQPRTSGEQHRVRHVPLRPRLVVHRHQVRRPAPTARARQLTESCFVRETYSKGGHSAFAASLPCMRCKSAAASRHVTVLHCYIGILRHHKAADLTKVVAAHCWLQGRAAKGIKEALTAVCTFKAWVVNYLAYRRTLGRY